MNPVRTQKTAYTQSMAEPCTRIQPGIKSNKLSEF